ncbi:H/ACA ribonucleoprotein complex non-core subunit NAF1 [Tachysurus vachellii]|uniref:H/ACA ribonucleoprotein complex non-core subunit NAF1 n=1 Tax=Tachysurus vachellii TaxID=175792 RepID=UPI00296B4F86|nr:H/ACA ribonucleoprotein complex non-core subunit NAF1 [Tachysurus vachellii]
MMETKTTEGLMSYQCELVKDELEKLSPEDEKAGESHTQSSTTQAELQRREVVPDLGEKGMITQMETGVSVCGTVEMDSVGHGAVFETCTAKSTPSPSGAMETCVSEQDGDQHPVEKDSTGREVVPESRTAEITPKAKEEMESSVCEQNGDQHSDAEKNTVEKDVVSPLLVGGGSLALLSAQYRDESSDDLSESDSDSSSSTSSSSSSSSFEPVIVKKVCEQDEEEEAAAPGKKTATLRTQDELLIEDLPAVENLTIGLPEDTDMEPVGIISSIVDQLVIVESKRDTQPLNEDSILFSKGRVSIGRVFEVFGPVCQPYYILRFNSLEDIQQRDLKIRDPVYFAPKIKDFTEYIFVEKIKLAKGSDASWKNDQEPPPEALDFSDDEEERMAKQKLKAQRRPQQQKPEESDSDSESSASRPPPPPRRKPRQNRNPQRGRPAHQEHHGGFHANYHTNPHFQQDFIHHPPVMHHPPDPYRPPFQGRGYPPPYPQPPPPHMGINLWHPCPYPGPMFYPPPPPPPPPAPPSI